jgi:hypothetical protein
MTDYDSDDDDEKFVYIAGDKMEFWVSPTIRVVGGGKRVKISGRARDKGTSLILP